MKKSLVRKFAYFIVFLGLLAFGAMHYINAKLPDDKKFPDEARGALKHAKSVTLYSLDGEFSMDKSSEKLYRYPIRSKVELDASQGQKAAQAILDTVPLFPSMSMAMCFDPHHALRVQHAGHQYDFVVCYKCSNEAIYKDGKQIAFISIAGSPTKLDQLLDAAKGQQKNRAGVAPGAVRF